MVAVVQWTSSDGGSPRIPTRSVPPFFCASAVRGFRPSSASDTRTSSATGRYAVSDMSGPRWWPLTLFLDPHVVEADALGLLVEALCGVADRAKPEQVAVPDHRHLLVEQPRLLLPERRALLRIGLARQLGLDLGDVLVGRPARPARREKDDVGRVVEGADAGGERVVLLRIVAALHQGGPVHNLKVDVEAEVLELLLRQQGEVVHPLVLLRRHEADRLLLVAGLLQELLDLRLVVLVPRQPRELRVPGDGLGHDQAGVHP